jgi:hypothetical protein
MDLKRKLIPLLLVLLASVFCGEASADATVRSQVINGDPDRSGSAFTVLVEVASNDTGLKPEACDLAVSYDPEAVTFIGAAPRDLGNVQVGSLVGTSSGVTRSITTAGAASASETPELFLMSFMVNSDVKGPYDIAIGPGSSSRSLGAVSTSFDNSGTSGLGARIF